MPISRIAPKVTAAPPGSPSSSWKSAPSKSTSPFGPTMPPVPKISRCSAAPPMTANHRKVIIAGTSRTPHTNSRTVRPFDTRAMKMPTKGAHEIHQPQ